MLQVKRCVCAQLLSPVRLFASPWTVAHQAALSMEFSRQEYGLGCHFLLQGSSQPRDQIWVSCISWTGRWILYPLSHLGSPLLLIVLFCNPLCVCVFICIRKYIVTKLTLKSLYLKIKRQEEIWLADKKENFMYVKKKVWSTMLLITFLNCSFCWLPFSWLTFLHWCLFVFGFVLGGSDL